jgi:hypothetical protein
MRMAYPVLYLPFHLIRSAPGQKAEAKPGRPYPRERRQGKSAMTCCEEARLAGRMGSRLSRVGGRASPHRAKSVLPSPQKGVLDAVQAVDCAQTGMMQHAITFDTRFDHSTDEVPRRRVPRAGPVTASYKKNSKGKPHASVPGTRSHWPRLQGCQQIQSSPVFRDERRNRYQFVRSGFDTGKVSSTAAATKWPARTSSWKPVFTLRNAPQHESQNGGTNPLR